MKKSLLFVVTLLCAGCTEHDISHTGKVLDKFMAGNSRQYVYTMEDSFGNRYKVDEFYIKGKKILMPGEQADWIEVTFQ